MRCLAMAVMLFTPAADADADWLFTGFGGSTFAGSTSLFDPERGAEVAHFVFGASAGWLGDGVLGVEGEVALVPKFFERGSRGSNLVIDSNVTTAMAGVLVAMPLSVTQYSLRPYATGGVGLIHTGIDDFVNFATTVNSGDSVAGLHVGGGALGFVTPDAGVRFDLRHIRSLSRERDVVTLDRRSKLSFWRLSVGVIIRY